MVLTGQSWQIPSSADPEAFQHLLLDEIKRSLRYPEFFAVLLLSPDLPNGTGTDGRTAERERLLEFLLGNASQELRDSDLIGRHGTQLGILLPHASAAETRIAAERVREQIKSVKFPSELTGGGTQMTASLGGACFPTDGRDPSSLLQRALLALRRAREAGGDRAVMFEDLSVRR
jgi:diguanylate cyclase (GGDEF)-like protein